MQKQMAVAGPEHGMVMDGQTATASNSHFGLSRSRRSISAISLICSSIRIWKLAMRDLTYDSLKSTVVKASTQAQAPYDGIL